MRPDAGIVSPQAPRILYPAKAGPRADATTSYFCRIEKIGEDTLNDESLQMEDFQYGGLAFELWL